MKMYPVRSTALLGLLFIVVNNSTIYSVNDSNESATQLPKFHKIVNILRYSIDTGAKGLLRVKNFMTIYAIPYTISGSQKFIQNYAIPYTHAGYTHTKKFIQYYVIPSVITMCKAGYNTAKTFYRTKIRGEQPIIQHPEHFDPTIHQDTQIYPSTTTEPSMNPLQSPDLNIMVENNSAYQPSAPPEEKPECCICSEPFKQNRVKLEPCGHDLFCKKCINDNRRYGRTTCPYCAQEVNNIIDYQDNDL